MPSGAQSHHDAAPTLTRVSVVLPVYAGAAPPHLADSVRSLIDQTEPATELVVVEDGPLLAEHRRVLDELGSECSGLNRVRLREHRGIAAALQIGIQEAGCPWIARMDADDIAVATRFERQMAALYLGQHDVLGTAMLEFRSEPDQIIGTRTMPTSHDAIARYMRRANPVNHPTAIFRRDLALDVGGYQAVPGAEDYDFFARMLAAGARFGNLSEALMLFRANADMFARRRGRGMFKAELLLQQNLHRYGLIGPVRGATNLVLRTGFRMLPPAAMELAYGRLFHDRGRPR